MRKNWARILIHEWGKKKMDQNIKISPSRIGQPRMKPILFEGKRYEQIMNVHSEAQAQRTGLMAIYDEASNVRLKIVRIYDVARDEKIEADIQDVFFIKFELLAPTRELLIENERHQTFIFNIDQGEVWAAK